MYYFCKRCNINNWPRYNLIISKMKIVVLLFKNLYPFKNLSNSCGSFNSPLKHHYIINYVILSKLCIYVFLAKIYKTFQLCQIQREYLIIRFYKIKNFLIQQRNTKYLKAFLGLKFSKY